MWPISYHLRLTFSIDEAAASLHAAKVGAINVGFLGELLLGKANNLAPMANILAESSKRWMSQWHPHT